VFRFICPILALLVVCLLLGAQEIAGGGGGGLPLGGGTLTGDITLQQAGEPTITMNDTTNNVVGRIQVTDHWLDIGTLSNHPILWRTNDTIMMGMGVDANLAFGTTTGTTHTLTFNVSGTDPVLSGSNGVLNLSTGVLQVGGQRVSRTFRHATDCTAQESGTQDDFCIETDDSDLYVCGAAECNASGWVNLTP